MFVLVVIVLVLAAGSVACGGSTPPVGRVQGTEGATLPALADTWLDASTADTNYGGNSLLRVGTSDSRRTLLAFDLAGIPAGATITRAELGLHHYDLVNGAGDVGIGLYAVLRPWAEGEATWSHATAADAWGQAGCDHPLTDRSTVAATTITATAASAGGYITATVTALVQDWVSGALANEGLVLIADAGAGNYARWTARNGANPPRLYVEWTAPGPTLTPTATATATATSTPTATPACPAQVRESQTWGPGVVTLDCDVGVAEGVTLTLAAGTELRFGDGPQGAYRLDVRGALVAEGTAAQPVTLTATTPLAGAWGQVLLRGPSPSRLTYCTIEYGGGINDAAGSTLRQTRVQTCTYGLATMSATDALSCTFSTNTYGVLLYGAASPTIHNCNIFNNTWDVFCEQARTIAMPGVWWGAETGPQPERVWDATDDLSLGAIDASAWATAPVQW